MIACLSIYRDFYTFGDLGNTTSWASYGVGVDRVLGFYSLPMHKDQDCDCSARIAV